MADDLIERLLEIEKLAYMGGSDTAGEIVERAHEAAEALSAQSREIAALREALGRAAKSLEAGDRLYACPGLHEAAKLAHKALKDAR